MTLQLFGRHSQFFLHPSFLKAEAENPPVPPFKKKGKGGFGFPESFDCLKTLIFS